MPAADQRAPSHRCTPGRSALSAPPEMTKTQHLLARIGQRRCAPAVHAATRVCGARRRRATPCGGTFAGHGRGKEASREAEGAGRALPAGVRRATPGGSGHPCPGGQGGVGREVGWCRLRVDGASAPGGRLAVVSPARCRRGGCRAAPPHAERVASAPDRGGAHEHTPWRAQARATGTGVSQGASAAARHPRQEAVGVPRAWRGRYTREVDGGGGPAGARAPRGRGAQPQRARHCSLVWRCRPSSAPSAVLDRHARQAAALHGVAGVIGVVGLHGRGPLLRCQPYPPAVPAGPGPNGYLCLRTIPVTGRGDRKQKGPETWVTVTGVV